MRTIVAVVVFLLGLGAIVWSVVSAKKTKSKLVKGGNKIALQSIGAYSVVQVSRDANVRAPVHVTLVKRGFRMRPKNYVYFCFPHGHISYEKIVLLDAQAQVTMRHCNAAGTGVSEFHLPLDRAERYLEVVIGW